MADDRDLYRFVIKAYSPETIPMSRLAEYMADLADLLGEKDAVHFVRIEESSTAIAWRAEDEAKPKIRDRVNAVRFREGPADAANAYRKLDRRLRSDNGYGYITEPAGAQIIDFPGARADRHQAYSPFWQLGHLVGVVALVGAKRGRVPVAQRQWVPVHLEQGERTYNCVARRSVARRLGVYLLADPVRVTGRGRWERGTDGVWTMLEFQIADVETLDNAPLRAVVDRLREVPGSWKDTTDPLERMAAINRSDDDEAEE